MKYHNHNYFIKCGILDELKAKIFYSNNKKYLFYLWDYNKNVLLFNFREEKDAIICCNHNKFWSYENNKNRIELIKDIQNYNKNILKGSKFTIINRYENGDAYGIEKY